MVASPESTNRILWWLVGILASVILVSASFYLNFVAKAVDDIRSDLNEIKQAVIKLEVQTLSRSDVVDMIVTRVPWPKDKAMIVKSIAELLRRIEELEEMNEP